MATNQEVQTLEETLNKTDLGHVINENKRPILIAAAIVVLAIVAYSIFNYSKSQARLANLDLAFEVEQSVFSAYLEDKIKEEEFITKLQTLDKKLIGHANLVPSLIASINKVAAKDKIISLAENWLKNIKKSNFLHLFLSLRLAALYEDQENYDMAITTLENEVGSPSKFLKDKIHFDLGRLYLKKGDRKTAQDRFNILLVEDEKNSFDQAPSDYAKLAKIYLSEF